MKIVLASNNKGKLREFNRLLSPLNIEVHPQGEFNIPAADEPYGTFLENCLAKARHAAKLTGLPAIADDSGICVNALGGAPGVHSARFAGEPGDDQRNNALLAVYWSLYAVRKILNPSSQKAVGTEKSLILLAEKVVLAMIPTSFCRKWKKPPQN